MDGEKNGKAYFLMDDLGYPYFWKHPYNYITHIWVLSKYVDDTMLCGTEMCSLSNMFVLCFFGEKRELKDTERNSPLNGPSILKVL